MSKHKKIRFIIHYVKPTAQLLFKIRFPKGGQNDISVSVLVQVESY